MNWNEIERDWVEVREHMRRNWDRLTDADLDRIAGIRERAILQLQQTYGYTPEQAEAVLANWQRTLRRRMS